MVVVNQPAEQSTNEQPAELQITVHPTEETMREKTLIEVSVQPLVKVPM